LNKVLQGQFESIEDYNSTFKKVKIKVFAFGENDNSSNITPESFVKAKDSIYNIPIVAKYEENTMDEYGLDGDLSGHNTRLKKDKDGNWILFQDTVPLGLVPESAEITFEEVNEGTEEEPDIKTYVVANGCFLWMRYEASQKIEEWLNEGIIPKVSMEINPTDGELVDGYYQINEWEFEAITALGSDKNPCFNRAEIEEYSKKNFKEMYFEMINELKQFTKETLDLGGELENNNLNMSINEDKQGGIDVDEKLELFNKYTTIPEDIVTQLKVDIEQYSLEELDVKLFELSGLLEEELRRELWQEKWTDSWGYECSRFYLWDFDFEANLVFAYDNSDSYLYKFSYTTSGDTVSIDFESGVKQKLVPVDFDEGSTFEFSFVPKEKFEIVANDLVAQKENIEQFETIKGELETLKADYEAIKGQNEKLSEYKSAVEQEQFEYNIQVLFENYSKILDEATINEFKEKVNEFSLETLPELETQMKLAFAESKITFETKKEKTPLSFEFEKTVKTSSKPYADLIMKYSKEEN
jgi:hypothetical protein